MKIITIILGNGVALLCSSSRGLTDWLEDFDHSDSERVPRNQLRDYSCRITYMNIVKLSKNHYKVSVFLNAFCFH